MTKHLIIDLDSLLYRAGFSVEKNYRYVTVKGEDKYRAVFTKMKTLNEWLKDNGLERDDVEIHTHTETEGPEEACLLLSKLVKDILAKFPSYTPTTYMGGKAQYRYDIYPNYKITRRDTPKPIHYDVLFKHALNYGAIVPEHYEADDACCIHAYKAMEAGEDYVIARIDKDLAQIPGPHYNYVTEEVVNITPIEAAYNFYTQLLTGDTSDSIPGVPGIGPVKAATLLAECDSEQDMYELCEKVYNDFKIPLEDMHRNTKLLYLLRKDDVPSKR